MGVGSWVVAAGPLGDEALAARCAHGARAAAAAAAAHCSCGAAWTAAGPFLSATHLTAVYAHSHTHLHTSSGEITDGDRAVLSLKAQRRKLEDQAKLVRL